MFEKPEKKYEQHPTICNTVRFNMTDENVKNKSRKLPLIEARRIISPGG